MKVLASDYDGTLLFNEKFKEGDLKKIKEFQKAGNLFGLCSGRPFKGIYEFCKHGEIFKALAIFAPAFFFESLCCGFSAFDFCFFTGHKGELPAFAYLVKVAYLSVVKELSSAPNIIVKRW